MRKATAFRGGANKTAPPCETLSENKYFPTVPVEQLERKTFLKVLLLEKTVFIVRQKGVPPLLLPTSVQQLPRCLVRICNLFHKGNQIANWKVSKKCNCSRETLLQNNLLRKCGLLAHTSAAFLKNCCTEKLFNCLRLDSYSQYANKFVSQSTILSTSFEKMVEIGNTTPTFTHIYILIMTIVFEMFACIDAYR